MYVGTVKKEHINSVFSKCIQYGILIRWLLSDSLWRFRGSSVLTFASGFFGVSFQIVAVGQVLFYAKLMEGGEAQTILGYEFEARDSLRVLVLWAFGALVSLLISAWLIYFSRANALRLARRYEEFCAKRVLSLAGSSLKLWTESGNGVGTDRSILMIARADSRYCGVTIRLLLNLVTPAVTSLFAITAIIYINPILTFMILGIVAVSAIFQYRVNVTSVRHSHNLEKYARDVGREYYKIIKQQQWTAVPLPEEDPLLKEIFVSTKVKKYMDAFEGRRKSLESSHLVSNILLATAVFMIMITLGSSIIIHGEGWGRLIIYLVALRFALVNLKQSTRSITAINRYYPQLKRYFKFLKYTVMPSDYMETRSVSFSLKADTGTLGDTLKSWDISRGSLVGLISPVRLNRYTLAFLIDRFLWHLPEAVTGALCSMRFVTSKYQPRFDRPLIDSLGNLSVSDWEDFCRKTEGSGLSERFDELLPGGFEKPVSQEMWDNIGADIKVSMAILASLRSDCQWIMLEEEGLSSLPDPARRYFLKRLEDRITVIVYHNSINRIGKYNEDILSLVSETGIVALGSVDWFKENRARIEGILNEWIVKDKDRILLEKDDELDMDDI